MSTIDDLIDEFLRWHWTESPVSATTLGVDGYDDRMPDLSSAAFTRRHRAEDDFALRFAALAEADLTNEERIDRDALLAHLRGSQILRDWEVWRRNPDTYLTPGLMGTFMLFMRAPMPEAELAAAAVARLGAVPDLLEQGRTNLDPERVSPVLARRALGQCRAAITYVRDILPAEVEADEPRAALIEACLVAGDAYEGFLPLLEDLADNARGSYAIGAERYGTMLRERELLPFDAEGLRAHGREVYNELETEIRAVAREVGGSDDWRAVLDDVNADHPTSPDEMLDGYAKCSERARRFLAEHELVTLPDGEACEVLPSPPFQRPVLAVASYFGPPAFKPSLVGRFNVPYPPEDADADDVQKRLADNSWASIPTTTVHEAYPGHHWHYAMLQSKARPIRRVIGTSYFTEGWALYAERMMREQGFFTNPREDLCHLDARIFRAARIIVDTSLHIGDMDFEEAVEFMRTKASLTEPTARAEVARYCSWPTQAASYLTGALVIEDIRQRFLGGGQGDLRAFHDRLAGSGALPPALAERALTGG